MVRPRSKRVPTTVRQRNTTDQAGFDSLKVSEQALGELGDIQVLVKSKLPSYSVAISLRLSEPLRQSRARLSTCVSIVIL